jgi:hypothetical protein
LFEEFFKIPDYKILIEPAFSNADFGLNEILFSIAEYFVTCKKNV